MESNLPGSGVGEREGARELWCLGAAFNQADDAGYLGARECAVQ